MSKNLSSEQLSDYLTENIQQIGRVRKEVEEIQVGFNSSFVEWKAKHDAKLEQLTGVLIDSMNNIGPTLQHKIETRREEERQRLKEHREQLREQLIPGAQAEADQILENGQYLTDGLRELNPKLNQREEDLKARRTALEAELAQLNEQIRRLSGCIGVVINFGKIGKLDRQRQRIIGELKAVNMDLKEVRDEWQNTSQEIDSEQVDLQNQWQKKTLELAQLQGELNYLDDDATRESMALKSAARYILDNLKEPADCPDQDLKGELDQMVELNIRSDQYQQGLGAVSGIIALLDGIIQGLERFNESVKGLIDEQRMHSSYLPKLKISVPAEVLEFHRQWEGLYQKVQDDHQICAEPEMFMESIQPVIDHDLSEVNIKGMFENLGQALKQSTESWR
jgi:chromosome segregation ATPase